MGKLNKYFSEHVNFSGCVHVSVGLGIAWLVSLAWCYSVVALVLGIVFLVAGIIGQVSIRFINLNICSRPVVSDSFYWDSCFTRSSAVTGVEHSMAIEIVISGGRDEVF